MKLRTVSRLVSCGNTDWFLNGFGHQTEFPFFESKTGLDKGRYRGSAAVMRIYGDMGKLDLASWEVSIGVMPKAYSLLVSVMFALLRQRIGLILL